MPKTVASDGGETSKQNQNAGALRGESRTEQAEARTAQAETRTEQARTRTELAETRTEQAETRTELAKTRTEQAETRTEQAETRTEQAELRTERAESALQRVVSNGASEHALAVPDPNSPVEDLTGRQREILQFIAEGQNTKQIAEILKVSPKTVEVHRVNMKQKLNVATAPELIRFAVRWVESQKPA